MKNLIIYIVLLAIALLLIGINSLLSIIPIIAVMGLILYNHIKVGKSFRAEQTATTDTATPIIKEKRCTDYLTGLRNREHYVNAAKTLIEQDEEFAVFYVDLNNFKSINDIFGHDIGDIVLAEVGKRLKSIEKDDMFFARFGGDEFAILYRTIEQDKINALGDEIKAVLNPPLLISESEFRITASVGVSRFPIDSRDLEDLFKLADTAMYHAKKSGLDEYYLISDDLTRKLSLKKRIGELLKTIDTEKELHLLYQPKIDFKTGELMGVEALVRWVKDGELLMPADFIPVAEEIDIVKDITSWTFITALNQIKTWNETYNKDLVVSLNVANSCIHNRIFFENLKFMLDNFDINPKWIAIELTEVILLVSPAYMKQLLVSINELGVATYVDDFGTGCISIPTLREFKVDTIKIDNSFITDINNNKDKKDIAKAMIRLSKGLDIKSCAEGVETKEQYETLKELGCDNFHGFYKDEPLTATEFEDKYLKS